MKKPYIASQKWGLIMTSELFHRGRYSHISMPFFLTEDLVTRPAQFMPSQFCSNFVWLILGFSWCGGPRTLNFWIAWLCFVLEHFFFLWVFTVLFPYCFTYIQIRKWSCKWWLMQAVATTWSYWDLNNMFVWLVLWRAWVMSGMVTTLWH